MKIAIATALLESTPQSSLKRAYLEQLLPTLKTVGHEVLLLTTHWGEERRDQLNLDWQLEGVECKSFPTSMDFVECSPHAQSGVQEHDDIPVTRIQERLALDSQGYTESLLTFMQEHIRTIDICMFVSLTDPFALLGPLAFKEKSLVVPLMHEDLRTTNFYFRRALKFVGKIGCATPGELKFFKENPEPEVASKAFLLGMPGPIFPIEISKSGPTLERRPLIFDITSVPKPPLNLELLRAFSAGRAVCCYSSDRFLVEDIRDSFGGWIKPTEHKPAHSDVCFYESPSRGRNALSYYNWLSKSENFAARLAQNWTSDHDHPFKRFRGRRVVIAYRLVNKIDAVGYDVIKQCETLIELGIDAKIYCQYCDETLEDMRASQDHLESVLQDPSGTLIYHLAISWPNFEDLIMTARCYRLAKYHNITPKEFFLPYSHELMRECSRARETLALLVASGQFEGYWADSEYNRQELIQYGAPSQLCTVMAPYNKALSISIAKLSTVAFDMMNQDSLKILCVGRIAPNKGHKDLIWAVAEYVRIFDRNIELCIVGAVDLRLNGYLDEIRQQIKECGLNDKVRICGRLSQSEIATLYHVCDALVMLSHHEGFCVPVVEAQENGLPVIAYRTSALVETVNDKTALCDVGDFYSIALKMNAIRKSSTKNSRSENAFTQ